MYTLYNNNDNIVYMYIGLPSRGSRAGDEHGGDGGQRRSHPARGTRSECAPEALLLLYICIQCIYIILYNIYMYIHLYMFTHTHTHTHKHRYTMWMRTRSFRSLTAHLMPLFARALSSTTPSLKPYWPVCVCVCVCIWTRLSNTTHMYI